MSTSTKLTALDGSSFKDPHLYRSVVGSLQYLTFTCPDISFIVNKVCQFMHCPKNSHWQALKCILRSLRLTTHFRLHFATNSLFNIHVYSDADWAGCSNDKKSIGSFCIFFGLHLIS